MFQILRLILTAAFIMTAAFSQTRTSSEPDAGNDSGFEALVIPSVADFKAEEERIKKEYNTKRDDLNRALTFLEDAQRQHPEDSTLAVKAPAYRALFHDNEREFHKRMWQHIEELVNRLTTGLKRFETDLSLERAQEVMERLRSSQKEFLEMITQDEANLAQIEDPRKRLEARESLLLARAQLDDLERKIAQHERLLHNRDLIVTETEREIDTADHAKRKHQRQEQIERTIRDSEAEESLLQQFIRTYLPGKIGEEQARPSRAQAVRPSTVQ